MNEAQPSMWNLEVSGHWTGDMHERDRQFEGQILSSEHEQLAEWCPVTVRFESGPERLGSDPQRAQQHGQYVLRCLNDSAEFVLTTFAREDQPYASSERRSEREEVWRGQAITR